MKAKIIKTDEIIYDAVERDTQGGGLWVFGRNKNGESINIRSSDVIMLPSEMQKDIDWEQRRYELIKTFAAAILSNSYLADNSYTKPNYGRVGSIGRGNILRDSILIADELIKQLKESEKEK